MAEKKLHLVAFVAHPIDEVKCVAGTFVKYARRKHKATTVIFTRPTSRGELPNSLSEEEVVETNLGQAQEAAKILGSGIECFHYDYEDLSVARDRACFSGARGRFEYGIQERGSCQR